MEPEGSLPHSHMPTTCPYPAYIYIYMYIHTHTHTHTHTYYFFVTQQHILDLRFLIIEASRSHSGTPHSERHLWTSDRPVAETPT